MGTILASAIITKARDLLQDGSAIRWTDPEALRWLNEAQRYIVLQRPDASPVVANITLVAGSKQSLPAAALRLIDIIRNMGVGGSTPGNAVRVTEREILDAQVPDWHTQASSVAIKHFVYDDRNPKTFYVYPPATVNATVESVYSTSPTDIATTGTAITLDDIYEPVLLDYLMYRSYSKDAEYAGDSPRVAFHLNAVNAALGIKLKIDVAVSPKSNAPGNPNKVGPAGTA